MTQQIWFITGISSGIGQALAQVVMEAGHFVIGTFRKGEQVATFNAQNPDQGLAIKLDVTQKVDIEKAYHIIQERFGRIDVLVNNAGVGIAGAIEETSDAEVRQVFDANFFGALDITRTFLPLFRQQGTGHIIQISSHGGIKAFAGFGIYNASKFALEGFSEALAQEVAPLGIKVSIVEPGPFRTKFAGSGFILAETEIADYTDTSGKFRQLIKGVDGKQEGDPQKAAQAILALAQNPTPPLRLPLGSIALKTIGMKLEQVQKDLDAGRVTAENATF